MGPGSSCLFWVGVSIGWAFRIGAEHCKFLLSQGSHFLGQVRLAGLHWRRLVQEGNGRHAKCTDFNLCFSTKVAFEIIELTGLPFPARWEFHMVSHGLLWVCRRSGHQWKILVICNDSSRSLEKSRRPFGECPG